MKNISPVGFTPLSIKRRDLTPGAGFTLVELLIVMVILSVILLSVCAHMESGLKLWRRANQKDARRDTAVFLEKFTADVRSSFRFKGLEFNGEADRVDLSSILYSPRLKNETVGQISYVYEKEKENLYRQKKDYSDIWNKESGLHSGVLQHVESAVFYYYYFDKEKKEFVWGDVFKGSLPLAVRLEFKIKYEDQTEKITWTVSIPAAG